MPFFARKTSVSAPDAGRPCAPAPVREACRIYDSLLWPLCLLHLAVSMSYQQLFSLKAQRFELEAHSFSLFYQCVLFFLCACSYLRFIRLQPLLKHLYKLTICPHKTPVGMGGCVYCSNPSFMWLHSFILHTWVQIRRFTDTAAGKMKDEQTNREKTLFICLFPA